MNFVDVLGLVAGTLTTVAFVPQVLKTWNTRSAGDISLSMFVLFTLGVGLWLCYGVYLASLPIILANAVTFVLAATILYFKIRYK